MCINTKFRVTQKYYSSCLTSSIFITTRFNIAPILRGREMRRRNVAFCKTRPFFFELKIGADVVCARHASLSAPCSNVFLGKECTTSPKNLCAGDYFRILQNTFRRKKRLVAGYSGIPDCAWYVAWQIHDVATGSSLDADLLLVEFDTYTTPASDKEEDDMWTKWKCILSFFCPPWRLYPSYWNMEGKYNLRSPGRPSCGETKCCFPERIRKMGLSSFRF